MVIQSEPEGFHESLLPAYDVDAREEVELVAPVIHALQLASANGDVVAAKVFAGTVYRDKAGIAVHRFGHPGSRRYESPDDDFYLQIGVRINRRAADGVLDAITSIEEEMTDRALQTVKGALLEAQSRTAAAQADEERLRAQIARLVSTKPTGTE